MADNAFSISPQHIYVFGAGRWARVILGILIEHLPEGTDLTVISRHHAGVMMDWVKRRERRLPIEVVEYLPHKVDHKSVAIVANAANSHETAIRDSLSRQLSVLVEKPLSLSAQSTRNLIEMSREFGVHLAASHVFLFAQYFKHFAQIVKKTPCISGVRFFWSDPKAEVRYGERKGYDSSLSVITDVFQHIYSILQFVMVTTSVAYRGLDVKRGGASVDLRLTINDIPCSVGLARNDKKRIRLLEFDLVGEDTPLRLDFTTEPGIITGGDQDLIENPVCPSQLGPLGVQLKVFLEGVVRGKLDHRLSTDIALAANLLMDDMMKDYLSLQSSWLESYNKEEFDHPNTEDEDLEYAMTELAKAR